MHFYNHGEFEMALEGLLIEMINAKEYPKKCQISDVISLCYYYKIGSRVFFSLVVENVASDNQQMFYTLPAGYRPLTNIYTGTFQGSGIYIRTNGDVHASPINGKLYCHLEFDAFR